MSIDNIKPGDDWNTGQLTDEQTTAIADSELLD